MDFSAICRTCLSVNSLNPIFLINNDKDTYSNAIYVATGVQIQYNDNLPQNMCTVCINKLNNILKFRKRCKDVESKLLSIVTEDKPVVVDKYCQENIHSTSQRSIINIGNENNSVCIKAECNDNKIKNETDIENDKALKLLLNSQTSTIKVFKLEENIEYESKDENIQNNYESESKISDTDISDDEIQEKLTQKKNIKSQTLKKSRTQNMRNTVINKINDKEITCDNDTETKLMAEPYELIMDPITQKVSKVFCKLCNKELSIRSIDSHITRRHPGADGRKVKCDLCDTYVLKDKLNRHKVMMHGNGCFRCGYCKSEFDSKEELLEHVSSCTSKKRKRKVNEAGRELRECDVCHKVMQKASLRMHKAVKHAGLRPVCEHCGKSFGNKFRLNEHYRAKHGYEKFQCSYCEFRSAGAMSMRNHERRHRGEKPFICEACGAKFHAAYLLAQHKHSHRTEKLVKCDLCPATFKANNSLHMHKLTCHSNSMYRCAVCCRSYKCRHYAVKHVRHVHRYTGPTPPLTVVTNDELVKNTT